MRSDQHHASRRCVGPVNAKWLLLVLVGLALLCQLPCGAEFEPELSHSYLQTQFAWAMYIDSCEVNHYLNYPGSSLHPLTKVRIRYRYFPHDGRPVNWPAKTYDEFWYHDGKPVGLRRNAEINLNKNDIGVIVIGQAADHFNSISSTSDALVRLLVNLQLQRAVVGAVIVPPDQYDPLLANLERYGFSSTMKQVSGPQMKIHLRCDSGSRETYLCLH
ncbi:MAG: hypothetical protein SH820_17520 [Xanthomonadales bacterium]|nr:hypothetical protein [Xanthomonadales bacterium]